jgi:hypothetical protein
MKHASRTGILAVFLLAFVAMVAWLASPSIWIAGSAELGPSTGTPTAEEKIESQGIDPQCIVELETLCGAIQPGGGRIQKCFDDKIDKISPLCQQQLMGGKAEAAAAILASRHQKELEKKEMESRRQKELSPIALTNMAIIELTDPPALGGRTTVDLNKRWGSDLGQINKATALLQDAHGKVGGGNRRATRLLEESIAYGKAYEHKEARLSAQGALFHLCKDDKDSKDSRDSRDSKDSRDEEACKKVPKYGAYVAP